MPSIRKLIGYFEEFSVPGQYTCRKISGYNRENKVFISVNLHFNLSSGLLLETSIRKNQIAKV